MRKGFKTVLLFSSLLYILTAKVQAEASEARELRGGEVLADFQGLQDPGLLFNGEPADWQEAENVTLTLKAPQGIGSLYFIFDRAPGIYWITGENGRTVSCGEEGFLHDYTDVTEAFGNPQKKLTLRFEEPVRAGELRIFGPGNPPEEIQRWKEAPSGGVDLLVFPAHGDDEQLFFAGLLPYYAGEKGYEVQVVYSTDHHNNNRIRPHEMLNGLWAVGVKNYPVFGPLPDYYSKSEGNAAAMLLESGWPREKIQGFIVEQLRKFRPLAAVGHDLNGEYGHGTHRLWGRLLAEAVEVSMDPEVFPESAEKYGVWDVPKTYLHLYGQDPVRINWDVPLSSFDGMTAYQVTKQLGYPAHKSQYTGFAWYLEEERAADISSLSPCEYGLYRSTVGPDRRKEDLFENLKSRREQEEEESRKRREAEMERQAALARRREEKRRAMEAESRRLQQESEQAEQRLQRLTKWEGAAYFLPTGILLASGLLMILMKKYRK